MENVNLTFKFANYCTYYKSWGSYKYVYNNKSLSICRPCFHSTYPPYTTSTIEQNIQIGIKKGIKKLKNGYNHYCPFDINKIKEHVNYLKELVDFEFNIEERRTQYIISVNFTGKAIYFRVIISWIRYLYEFPACMVMQDVYKIKDLPEFKDINIFSLSTFVFDCLNGKLYFDDLLCNNMKLSKLLSIKKIKLRLKHLETHNNKTMSMFLPEDNYEICEKFYENTMHSQRIDFDRT